MNLNHFKVTATTLDGQTVTGWLQQDHLSSDARYYVSLMDWSEIPGRYISYRVKPETVRRVDFRCGEGENRCNCEIPEDCGYIEFFREVNNLNNQ